MKKRKLLSLFIQRSLHYTKKILLYLVKKKIFSKEEKVIKILLDSISGTSLRFHTK